MKITVRYLAPCVLAARRGQKSDILERRSLSGVAERQSPLPCLGITVGGVTNMTRLSKQQLQILYSRICKNYDYSTAYGARLNGMRIRVLNEQHR